jgi:hypothetical protein
MSVVAKAADVWIIKTGGSTSAEALVMKKQVFSLDRGGDLSHSWEATNETRLIDLGLCKKLSGYETISSQVEAASQKKCPHFTVRDWREQLLESSKTNLNKNFFALPF